MKIPKGFETIIGKVETEYVEVDKGINGQYSSQEEYINRYLIIKLIGHIEGDSYRKGLTELPLIANECHLLTNKEFEMIHSFGSKDDVFIKIGTIASDPLVPISIGVNKLFASHIGIFGNTGSGKSYTLAKIYRQLFVSFKDNAKFRENTKFLFYDFNGEYLRRKLSLRGRKYMTYQQIRKRVQTKFHFRMMICLMRTSFVFLPVLQRKLKDLLLLDASSCTSLSVESLINSKII